MESAKIRKTASSAPRKGKLGSLDTLDLETRDWRIRIFPEIGAKIYDLIWKASARNFLWHNPRIAPGANFKCGHCI